VRQFVSSSHELVYKYPQRTQTIKIYYYVAQ